MRGHRLNPAIAALLALACASSCSAYTPGDPEFRGFWVDAWHAGALRQSQVDKLLGVVGDPSSLGDIRNANCNAVVVQVRRRADVCYPSAMGEPYMSGLSPSNFNALQALINAAHDTTGGKKRIEVHCWLVTFATASGTPGPVYYAHNNPADPDNYWPTRDNSGNETSDKAFDPGHPRCEEYLVNVCMDMVNNFDIDGVHYDYIRFTANNQGYNPTSIARYNARYGTTGQPSPSNEQFKQWRRDQVTALVRKVYAKIQATKPWVKQSGSFVTWNPSPTASTREAFQATRPYYDVYSDWDSWIAEGIVDMAIPMTYYNWASLPNDFTKWMNFEKDRKGNRHMVVGPGVYMNSLSNAILVLNKTRDASPAGNYAHGFCGYSYYAPYTLGGTNYGTWADLSPELVSQVTSAPADIPVMPWKVSPSKGHISGTVTDYSTGAWADGATVSIEGPEGRTMLCDGTGFYAFIDLTPGQYVVKASKAGCWTWQKIVDVAIGEVTGDMYVTDFTLGGPTPPMISNVQITSLPGAEPCVTWTTEQPATSRVEYGLTSSYGSTTPTDPTMTTSHQVYLPGLLPKTLYHCRVISGNAAGASTSLDFAFTTFGPPTVSNVQVTNITPTSATISWTTDGPATTQVYYGTGVPYSLWTTQDPTLATSHTVNLTGLTTNTVYHFNAESFGGTGLVGSSGDRTFATQLQPLTLVVDNLQGTSTFTWTALSDSGGWPTDASQYVYASNKKSTTTATFTWTPDIPITARYNVYCWYKSGTDRTTSARSTVAYSGGQMLVAVVNQTSGGSQWVKIADAKQFNAGTSGYVQLTNKTGEADGTKKVVADAIKFEYAETDTSAPTTPTDLAATAVSTSQIDLTWSPSTDNALMGYRVYRDAVIVGITSSTSFSDNWMPANTMHTYTVTAYDLSNNESAASAPASRCTFARPFLEDLYIECDKRPGTWQADPSFTFTNDGFGAGKVAYYRSVWDQSPTHVWTETESIWNTASMTLVAAGPYSYLHLKSYNEEAVTAGTHDFGPYLYGASYSRLADAMNNPDGTQVVISQYKPITGVFGSFFYIEESDRTRGIRVDATTTRSVGDTVSVAGRLAGSSGERRLADAQVLGFTSGTAPLAFAIRISTLGGKSPNPYTLGIPGANAPYNVGLLARVVGTVLSHGAGWFVLDEGSGAVVKVYSDKAVSDGNTVGATGVCCVEGGVAVLRTRTLADVMIY